MTGTLRICGWNEIYENSQSRKVDELRWVAMPNNHDGETYSLIMAEPNGAEIYAAWVLIVQVASKCTPRGTLVRDNGPPHSPKTLSIKTRAPAAWFEAAIKYLTEQSNWLEWIPTEDANPDGLASGARERPIVVKTTAEGPANGGQLPVGYHSGDTQLPVGYHSGGEEGRKEGRKERTPQKSMKGLVGFDLFWAAYPRKVCKAEAVAAFRKQGVEGKIDAVLAALEQQKQQPQWTKENGQFIPHPATWLNQHRWEDEPVDIQCATGRDTSNLFTFAP